MAKTTNIDAILKRWPRLTNYPRYQVLDAYRKWKSVEQKDEGLIENFIQSRSQLRDIVEAGTVEVLTAPDGRIWVNVDGVCVLRIGIANQFTTGGTR